MKFCKKFYSWRKVTAFISLLLFSLSMFFPLVVCAEDLERTITVKAFYHQYYGSSEVLGFSNVYKVTGMGRFVVRSYRYRKKGDDSHNGGYGMVFRLFSDKDFICQHSPAGGRAGTFSDKQVDCYNGIYYITFGISGGLLEKHDGHDVVETWSGFANLTVVADWDSIPTVEEIIDSGALDLTRDSYKEETDSSGYNKNLDFSYLKGDYKVKYTIERDSDGRWSFVNPDEAGIQLDWFNRKDIEGAYVKISVYGEFYEDFWNSSYANTVVTISDIDRNSLSYLLKQKDLIELAKTVLNKKSGYGFVVNYLYIQSFGVIDGRLCHGRIYKLNSDLVTDYGNADSEGDEYFPEITEGVPMPPEYVPDPDDPDPERTEPRPDPDDDTPIITPVPEPDEPAFDTDLDLLKALNSFFEGLKSSMTLLGDFPAFIANIFCFLPSSVISLISLGIISVIILRFIGR